MNVIVSDIHYHLHASQSVILLKCLVPDKGKYIIYITLRDWIPMDRVIAEYIDRKLEESYG